MRGRFIQFMKLFEDAGLMGGTPAPAQPGGSPMGGAGATGNTIDPKLQKDIRQAQQLKTKIPPGKPVPPALAKQVNALTASIQGAAARQNLTQLDNLIQQAQPNKPGASSQPQLGAAGAPVNNSQPRI